MDADIIVIGAGTIGLAVGQKVAYEGHAVILLEKEVQFKRKLPTHGIPDVLCNGGKSCPEYSIM